MILCVNPNAAVDKTLVVEHFRLNGMHRPSLELNLAGGKGCNVARVARSFGLEAVVTGWVGGHNGRWIEESIQAEGIQAAFVHTADESRTCVAIIDPLDNTLTELNERGRPVTAPELDAFYALYQEWLPRIQLVTLSGSLPPGVPADFYAEAARMARDAGVPALLDSSGEPLRLGLELGRPALLKCNRAELSGIVNEPLEQLDDLVRVILEIHRRWDTRVVITLGSGGAVAAMDGSTWLAQAPRIEAVSAVGSGDAFLAGLAVGLLSGRPLEESLPLAIAAGSANALQVGAGRLQMEDVERLRQQVHVAVLQPGGRLD